MNNTQPTVKIITRLQYEKEYKNKIKIGLLSLPDEWYDCLHHIDIEKMKKNITLPKGARVLNVFITTDINSEYENKQNKKIPYYHSVCADRTTDGAYYKKYGDDFGMWAVDYPVGNAIIVVNK